MQQTKNPFKALQKRQLQAIDGSCLADARHVEAKVNQIQRDLKKLRKRSTELPEPHVILRELQKVEQSIAAHALHCIDVTFNDLLSVQKKQQLQSSLFKYIGYEVPYHFHKNAKKSMLSFISCQLSKHKILSFFEDETLDKWSIDDIYVSCNEKICNSLMSHSTSIIQRLTMLKQQFSR